MKSSKIAIIGVGAVGSTTAYALLLRNVASEILLVDTNLDKCDGEVRDLSNALPVTSISQVRQATLKQAAQADIIIITAGKRQGLGQSRTDLITANKKIVCSILDGMKPINKEAIIIMVTNPVDTLTRVAQVESGLPVTQVMGSGTLLDTHRLCNVLAKKLNIAEQSLHVYVLGEHGEDQFVAWSSAMVGGKSLVDFAKLSKKECDQLEQETRKEVYKIIECKGATFFGVAACVTAMCENIVFNQRCVIPISCYMKELDIALSLPAALGCNGIERIIGISLSPDEQAKLQKAAEKLKSIYNAN